VSLREFFCVVTTQALRKTDETDRDAVWVYPKEPCIGRGPGSSQENRHFFGGHVPARCKVLGISGVRSIFSTLFGRWQQRCGFALSVLQQLVMY